MSSRLRAAAAGGPLAVAAGAALWGTDALFRWGLSQEHAAATIVFLEHVVLIVCVLPLLPATRPGRVAGKLAGVAGVAGHRRRGLRDGDHTFHASLHLRGPDHAAVAAEAPAAVRRAAAWVLLGERPRRAYGPLLVAGVIGAYLLAFPNPLSVGVSQLVPALLAVGAAALWAMGTVLGRYVSGWLAPREILTARIAVGLPASGLFVVITGVPAAVPSGDILAIVGLALVPGLLALAVYYHGLRRTPAMVATLAELAFPITATVIGRFVFEEMLSPSQWAGLVLLLATIVLLARPLHARREERDLVLTGDRQAA